MSMEARCFLWLQGIDNTPPVPSPPITTSRKRKRKRNDSVMSDPQLTPRPGRKRAYDDRDAGHSYSDADAGGISRTSSPSKRSQLSRTSISSSSIGRQINWMKAHELYHEEILNHSPQDLFPSDITNLIAELRQYADGSATIPAALRAPLIAHAPEEINPRRADLFTLSTNDANLPEPTWPQIQALVDEAQECHLRHEFEAGWNTGVHGPLLSLACALHGRNTGVRSVNLTQIRPMRRLTPQLPSSSAGGNGGGSGGGKKMVDFGLYIDGRKSKILHRAFRSDAILRPEDNGMKTWNASDQEQVAETPLVVCMETKREGEKGGEAQLQLGTWATAHLRRLLELKYRPEVGRTSVVVGMEGERRKVICLPQLKILGPVWTFMLACGEYDDAGQLLNITLYTGFELGNVTSYSGVFRVLACLRSLCRWVREHYQPWFEGWVTGNGQGDVS